MALFWKKDDQEVNFAQGDVVGGRYKLLREISRGGMGIVYHARDKTLSQEVALKFLPGALARNRKAVENLKQEARITMALSHPNVMRIYNFVDEPDFKYVVMEYVDGPTLEEVLDTKGKLTIEEMLRWAKGICEGLQYAHGNGVLHRDVKPSNIMLHKGEIVKITDFGIARRMKNQMHKLTKAVRLGTPPYMSPEQLMGEYMNHCSDIYSTGVVIYECLNGVPPFSEGSVETQIMLKKPHELLNVPDYVNKALRRALNKYPQNRWQSAIELYEALLGRREAEEAVYIEAREPKKRPVQKPTIPASEKPKVLVVDDEMDIRTLLGALLRVSGYIVEDASDGLEAVTMLTNHEFDLVLSDIYMPNMDGIQLLKHIRENDLTIPVVIVTASTAEKDILEGYNWGADYYITKPFDNECLLEIVSELTGGGDS